jgi:hypothetical protein
MTKFWSTKQQANQHKSKHSFSKGDQAFLHLQPNKHASLKDKVPCQLAPKLYGPYRIIECIG